MKRVRLCVSLSAAVFQAGMCVSDAAAAAARVLLPAKQEMQVRTRHCEDISAGACVRFLGGGQQ